MRGARPPIGLPFQWGLSSRWGIPPRFTKPNRCSRGGGGCNNSESGTDCVTDWHSWCHELGGRYARARDTDTPDPVDSLSRGVQLGWGAATGGVTPPSQNDRRGTSQPHRAPLQHDRHQDGTPTVNGAPRAAFDPLRRFELRPAAQLAPCIYYTPRDGLLRNLKHVTFTLCLLLLLTGGSDLP